MEKCLKIKLFHLYRQTTQKERRMKKRLLVVFALLLILILSLSIWGIFCIPPNPWCQVDAPEKIDRLEIYSAGEDPQSSKDDILLKVIDDPGKINKYIQKYRWEDGNAICCHEETRYAFLEYADGEEVGSSYYGGLFSRYNNLGFTLQQFLLIHIP